MDIGTIVLALVGLAGVALAGVGIYTLRKPVGVSGALQAIGQGLTQIEQAAIVAKDAVAAAEQIWAGQTEAGLQKFEWARSLIESFVPGLTDEAYRMTIEAAVYWLHQVESGLLIDDGEAE